MWGEGGRDIIKSIRSSSEASIRWWKDREIVQGKVSTGEIKDRSATRCPSSWSNRHGRQFFPSGPNPIIIPVVDYIRVSPLSTSSLSFFHKNIFSLGKGYTTYRLNFWIDRFVSNIFVEEKSDRYALEGSGKSYSIFRLNPPPFEAELASRSILTRQPLWNVSSVSAIN